MPTNNNALIDLNAAVSELKRITSIAELNTEKLDALNNKVRKVIRANSENAKHTACIDVALYASEQQDKFEMFNAMTLEAAKNAMFKLNDYAAKVLAEKEKSK